MDDFDETLSAARPKPSKTPSWIMLGFLLGAVFVWALPRSRDASSPAANVNSSRTQLLPAPARPPLTDVEAVFHEWGRYAVWADTTTYVCWYAPAGDAPDCFEVFRRGEDSFFFRSIPRPRNLRPIEGVPANSPLQFLNPVPETKGLFGLPVR